MTDITLSYRKVNIEFCKNGLTDEVTDKSDSSLVNLPSLSRNRLPPERFRKRHSHVESFQTLGILHTTDDSTKSKDENTPKPSSILIFKNKIKHLCSCRKKQEHSK